MKQLHVQYFEHGGFTIGESWFSF